MLVLIFDILCEDKVDQVVVFINENLVKIEDVTLVDNLLIVIIQEMEMRMEDFKVENDEQGDLIIDLIIV